MRRERYLVQAEAAVHRDAVYGCIAHPAQQRMLHHQPGAGSTFRRFRRNSRPCATSAALAAGPPQMASTHSSSWMLGGAPVANTGGAALGGAEGAAAAAGAAGADATGGAAPAGFAAAAAATAAPTATGSAVADATGATTSTGATTATTATTATGFATGSATTAGGGVLTAR
eukprot:scaffold77773_cov54-Phaeocystis_antarctica.AAC.1